MGTKAKAPVVAKQKSKPTMYVFAPTSTKLIDDMDGFCGVFKSVDEIKKFIMTEAPPQKPCGDCASFDDNCSYCEEANEDNQNFDLSSKYTVFELTPKYQLSLQINSESLSPNEDGPTEDPSDTFDF